MRRDNAFAARCWPYRSAKAIEDKARSLMPLAGQRGNGPWVGLLQTQQDYTCFFDHRAFAAFLAMAFLLLAGRRAARAFPPLRPPFLPIPARYSLTDGVCIGSSVDNRTISKALWFKSSGNCLLERLKHRV
jgi:hypothetical protein